MIVAAEMDLMTSEQLEAMPDDGVDRWLIQGQLRESSLEGDMTVRNRGHSWIEANFARELGNWLKGQPQPRGEVLVGEAGIRLRRNPDTTVGVDVAYISAETAEANPDLERLVEGAPVLIVEILSPSDRHWEVAEKVAAYLECGVKLVWVVDVRFRTVTVYRPDGEPELCNVEGELSGQPHLPGFCVKVGEMFGR